MRVQTEANGAATEVAAFSAPLISAGGSPADEGSSIREELASLDALGLEPLRMIWEARFGPAPKMRSPELLRLHLAWRIQADAYGGMSAVARAKLSGRRVAVEPTIRSGSRLVREWKGVPHEVIVTTDGFTYDGRAWKSLSEIARAITGSRWNGPRFFGLREPAGGAKV